MPVTVSHADFSRVRLLRLLDRLDQTARTPSARTVALPAATPLPAISLPRSDDALISSHAARSGTGAFIFADAAAAWIVAPPFPVTAFANEEGIHTAQLRELLARERRVAAVLLRLGGYAIGLYDGERLVEARNATRFVKNRHRKGGQSQRRFDRIREKQVDELFDHLCRDASERLSPYANGLDFIVYGGDRHTVQACLKVCRFLQEFPCPVLPRFLTVPEPRHETLVTLPALLTTSRVTSIAVDDAA